MKVWFGDCRRGCLKYSPENHRSLSLLGYLGRCDDRPGPAHPLQGLVPQTIAWGSLAVHVCNFRVPNSQVLYALNGAVVALCKVDENQVRYPSSDHSFILNETPLNSINLVPFHKIPLPYFISSKYTFTFFMASPK